jgi:hypothetical protein
MKRALEVTSGIAVLLISLQTSAVLIIACQRSGGRAPFTSVIYLALCGVELLLSFVGAYILLSWANKRR